MKTPRMLEFHDLLWTNKRIPPKTMRTAKCVEYQQKKILWSANRGVGGIRWIEEKRLGCFSSLQTMMFSKRKRDAP